jgi:type IV pilus assembly protein PilA
MNRGLQGTFAPRTRARPGFTLIEIVVVLAVIAILAMLAVPSLQDRIVREQIVDAMKLADLAKAPVAASWALTRTLPVDNAGVGLPVADKIVSNLVTSLSVEDGAIHVTFGNRANAAIRGKTLTLRPAVVDDAQIVPVAWVCGQASAVDKMTAKGIDRTDVAVNFLPLNCRAGS